MTADRKSITPQEAARAVLAWYRDMGVDAMVGEAPADFAAPARAPAPPSEPTPPRRPKPAARAKAPAVFRPSDEPAPSASEAIDAARRAAQACDSFEALKTAVEAFEGCPLKAGATRTVFADGAPGAPLLVIGEGPGREEDRSGLPFVGRAGQLLDKMLAAIGRDRRENVLISNVVYWRPPGNRTPTAAETAICRPFVDRLIELTNPRVVALAGAAPLQAMLGLSGIMRARGTWRTIETASGARVDALPMFHPAFLLRQPAMKRQAWADLQAIAEKLNAD